MSASRSLSAIAATVALVACSPQPLGKAAALDMPAACSTFDFSGALEPVSCALRAGERRARVTFEPVAEDAVGGNVRVDVVGEDGATAQTFTEANVSEYLAPSADDIDGDGRADILIPIARGNVNTQHAIWIYRSAESAYRRAGELSSVEITRTADGYIATEARSGAAAWSVSFYRLDEAGLAPLVILNVEAEGESGGRAVGITCTIEDAPGLQSLNLTPEAAQEKFCAEPAAGVFAQ